MLYRNDEQYKLLPGDVSLIRKKFVKFPVRLTYPDNRVKPSVSRHNIMPDKPNSINFPLRAVEKSTSGTDVWRYAENRTVGSKGELIYTPTHFGLTGTFVLQENDMELIWWLYTKCPYLEGGLNYNGRPAKCVFEDLIGKAERRAMQEAKIADVKALIYSSHLGLKEIKLRRVAKAYFIPDVDEKTFAQVKLALEIEIGRNKLDGVQKFLDLVNAEAELDIRGTLQEAVDKRLIKYFIPKREWAWLNDAGKKDETIAQVTVGVDPYEALINYYMEDRNFQQNIRSSIKGEKVVLAEGKGDIDDAVEN